MDQAPLAVRSDPGSSSEASRPGLLFPDTQAGTDSGGQNATSPNGQGKRPVSAAATRVDRHIVTSYQITRGEVSISQLRQLSGDSRERVVVAEAGGQGSSSSSSAADRESVSRSSHKEEQQQLPSSLLARQLEKVKDDIYRLLSEDSDASSLGRSINKT